MTTFTFGAAAVVSNHSCSKEGPGALALRPNCQSGFYALPAIEQCDLQCWPTMHAHVGESTSAITRKSCVWPKCSATATKLTAV